MEWSRTHFPNLTYWDDVDELKSISEEMSNYEEDNYKQILIDVKRTNSGEAFQAKIAKDMLTRVLFVWAFKHPASGYVQGINDLAATFMYVFIADVVHQTRQTSKLQKEVSEIDLDFDAYHITLDDMALLEDEQTQNIESDTYWCLENFLETLQENFTDKQPGVYQIIKRIDQIIHKKDPELIQILEEIDYTPEKCTYRWVNNILTREFNMQQLIMIWDKIIAEEEEVNDYLVYVCAALLMMFSKDIKKLAETPDEIIMYIQDLPTAKWKDDDIKLLMAETYQLQTLYRFNNHLNTVDS